MMLITGRLCQQQADAGVQRAGGTHAARPQRAAVDGQGGPPPERVVLKALEATSGIQAVQRVAAVAHQGGGHGSQRIRRWRRD